MIAAFGKVRRVGFASDRRIDALAQVARFRDLVVQISERVSPRRLQRIHNRRRELRVQWVLHSRIKSTRGSHTSFRNRVNGVPEFGCVHSSGAQRSVDGPRNGAAGCCGRWSVTLSPTTKTLP